jgi:anaerobic magnesium-protoporphyrin IX monomethyl ester cyclase
MPTEILFVNLPPYESYYARNTPHLGMLYVMTMLRGHGFEVGYLDCANANVRRQQILDAIGESAPRLIGFSIDTDNLFSVSHLSHELKEKYGERMRIVFGGPASQGHPEEIMRLSAADALVIGEGEYSTLEVADCLLRGKGNLSAVAGIAYRELGEIHFTDTRPPIADLDAIPFPDRRFLPNPDNYQSSIISGRGCPFRCTFCFEGRAGNNYRRRSAENIVAEMEEIVSARKRAFICINDDTFTSDPAHTLRLCRLIRERFRPWEDLVWFCEVRADIVNRHPELVDAMTEAGLARMQIGVESADEDVLRAYKRLNVRPKIVEEVVGRFHRAGVPSIYCGFILGGPRETMDTMRRTLDFAGHLLNNVAPGSFECNASFLTPLPGTDIRARPGEYGVRLLDPDLLTSSNFNYCTAETEALSQAEINNFRQYFVDEIGRQLHALVPSMPWDAIEKHVIMAEKFGISTAYHERLRRHARLWEYVQLVGKGKYERADQLSDEDLLQRFPTRLAAPLTMEDGRTTILRSPSELALNAMGSRVYSLCSGKLTVDGIARHLSGRLPEAPAETELRGDVIDFVRQMDRN